MKREVRSEVLHIAPMQWPAKLTPASDQSRHEVSWDSTGVYAMGLFSQEHAANEWETVVEAGKYSDDAVRGPKTTAEEDFVECGRTDL